MTIVAYGYGLESAPFAVTEAILLTLTAESDISLAEDVVITIAKDINIALDID